MQADSDLMRFISKIKKACGALAFQDLTMRTFRGPFHKIKAIKPNEASEPRDEDDDLDDDADCNSGSIFSVFISY